MKRRDTLVVFFCLLGAAGCGGSSRDSTGTSGSGAAATGSGAATGSAAATGSGRPSAPSPSAVVSVGPTGKTVLRPGDLLDAPDRHLGRTVEVEIVETLSGPPTPAALATATYGQVRALGSKAGRLRGSVRQRVRGLDAGWRHLAGLRAGLREERGAERAAPRPQHAPRAGHRAPVREAGRALRPSGQLRIPARRVEDRVSGAA